MPIIVNRNQQVRTGAVYPVSAYSRVVGFSLHIPADGNWHHATTPVVGQRVWLLRVTIRHCPRGPNVANYTLFETMTGRTRALTLADIGAWERVIPNIAEGGPSLSMRFGDGCTQYQEDMSKLYTGEARRFGVLAKRVGAGADNFEVSFLIAEG